MPLIALIVGVSILLMNEREYLKEGIKMTREEAIELFEKQLTAARVVLDSGFGSNPGENDILYRRRKEMAEIALTALTPPTQEQMERVWRGKWKYSHTSEIDHFAVVKC